MSERARRSVVPRAFWNTYLLHRVQRAAAPFTSG
jgi:lipid-A-disaccharide synthase-like uncharacterized protein